jgi:hypothetical protein
MCSEKEMKLKGHLNILLVEFVKRIGRKWEKWWIGRNSRIVSSFLYVDWLLN